MLKKGALVAQNPAGFESLTDIDEAEKQALRDETLHRWRHPWPLYYTIILNSIAAAIQGWDQVRSISCSCACLGAELTLLTDDCRTVDGLQWRQFVLPSRLGHL